MVLLHSVESIFIVIIMFMTGFFMTKFKMLNDQSANLFSKIILTISLPAYMINNICSTFTRDTLLGYARWIWIPFVSILMCYIVGIIISNVFRVAPGRKGVFRSIFFTSNTIFIGLPVNLALFGADSVAFVLFYYISNTLIFWTVGAYEISKDKDRASGTVKVRFFSVANLKRILSPVLISFFVAIILVLLNVSLPKFILSSCEYIGNLTTPLAMLFIGIVLYNSYRHVRFDRDIILLVAGRFLMAPFLVIFLTSIFQTPDLMAKVFVIQSAMPAMTSTSIVAKGYGSDIEFATMATVVTTVLSMIVIPAYMVLFK